MIQSSSGSSLAPWWRSHSSRSRSTCQSRASLRLSLRVALLLLGIVYSINAMRGEFIAGQLLDDRTHTLDEIIRVLDASVAVYPSRHIGELRDGILAVSREMQRLHPR